MTIAALPNNAFLQLQRQSAEAARDRAQQTPAADNASISQTQNRAQDSQRPTATPQRELEARLDELRTQREQRLETRRQAQQLTSNDSQSLAQERRVFTSEQPVQEAAQTQSQPQQVPVSGEQAREVQQNREAIRTEQRIAQDVEQREQQQARAAERAETIEEQRARRIRETVEAREVRQQENAQEAVQRREAGQAETTQRILTEARERARRLQDEVQEAQRRNAERQQAQSDTDISAVSQLQQQPASASVTQPDEVNVEADAVQPAQSENTDNTTLSESATEETDILDDAETTDELIDILREEADIIETLLRQQEIGSSLAGEQLDAELNEVRDTIREEVERSARIQRNNLPATSRLGYFIDQVS